LLVRFLASPLDENLTDAAPLIVWSYGNQEEFEMRNIGLRLASFGISDFLPYACVG
jgi:hypothetical protein